MLLGRGGSLAIRRLGVLSCATCSGFAFSKRGLARTSNFSDPRHLGWIVADMDGTLVGLPGFVAKGKYKAPTLAESPCLQPLCRWLRAGGRLLVVTSDDGDGPVRRVLQHLPPELLPRVLFSTSDGAALFHCTQGGDLVEAAGYGTDYCLKSDATYLQAVYDIARKMHIAFFRDLSADPDLLASLDDTLRSGYDGVLRAIAKGETSVEQAVTHETMLLPGRVKSFGTLVTRKQAGPSSHWVKIPDDKPVGGGGGTRPAELPVGWTDARWADFERSCCPDLIAPLTSVTLLGMPRHVSERYCNLVAKDLEELNLVASRAPNSVWIKRPGVDKGVPVRWLLQAFAAEGLTAHDIVAFGDMPLGNDAPLASFGTAGMPFISVGADPPSEAALGFHVGRNERGMAAVVSLLADALERELERAAAEHRPALSIGSLNMDIASAAARVAATPTSKL